MAKFGIEIIPAYNYSEIIRYAISAEKSGFEYVWVSDHIRHRNVYVCLTLIAINTKRIKIGPGVTNPYLIHPVVTAQALLSLSEIAQGRVVCGIGVGDKTGMNMLNVERKKPLKTIREAVEVIRRITTKESVTHQGDIFRVYGAGFSFKAEAVPIFIGAQGLKMARLAGEIGDGVLINTAHPRDFEIALKQVELGVSSSSKDMNSLEIAVFAPLSISNDERKALTVAKPIVARIVAGCSNKILKAHNIEKGDVVRIREAIMRGDRESAYSSVDSRMLEGFSIYGTPDECIEKIEELFDLGAKSFIAVIPMESDLVESIKLMKEEVLPYFEQK
ncbi:MAG: 5,10-methylenetetrahydromethanopterin reductase [archaeon]|nr:5,10-methylenetetrahydromethanopterin reductase [archaeon]MCP8306040.1 5,10-methylenetetrahydromethanopterin reductase [archaeon]